MKYLPRTLLVLFLCLVPLAPSIPDIMGGEVAAPGAWPWQVVLIDPSAGSDLDGFFCGGSLISAEWVVTAAHCVYDDNNHLVAPSTVQVVAGRRQLSANEGQRFNVSQIIPHPNYAVTGEEDIALLHLSSPAVLNSTVATIPLATTGDSALYAPGISSIVTGWGQISETGPISDILRQVAVPLVSNQTCQAAYNDDNTTIADSMICAGADGKDSCYGDSGGPLVVQNAAKNGYLLVGIVSFGHSAGCGAPGKYGVYARVPYLASWVTTNTGVTPPPAKTSTPTPTPTKTSTRTPTPVSPGSTSTPTPTRTFTPISPAKSSTPTRTSTPGGSCTAPGRTIACGGSDTARNDGSGSSNVLDGYACVDWEETGPEMVYTFNPGASRQVSASLSHMTGDLDLFVLSASGGGACNGADCLEADDTRVSFNAQAGSTYYLVVDGYLGDISNYTLKVTCSAVSTPTLDKFMFLPNVVR